MKLPATRAALKRLGFITPSIDYMVNHIMEILGRYPEPEKAAAQIEEILPTIPLSRFGGVQFKGFLRAIDPDTPFATELKFVRSQDLRTMDADERRERDKIIARFKMLRAEALQTHLLNPSVYESLSQAHFRKSQSQLGKNPPTPRFISVPMGGQVRK